MKREKKILNWIQKHTVILETTERQSDKTGRCIGIRLDHGLVLTACHCLTTISDKIQCHDMEGNLHTGGRVRLYTTANWLMIKDQLSCKCIPKTDCPDMALLQFDDLPKTEPITMARPKLLETVTIPVPLIHDGKLVYPLISQGPIACHEDKGSRIYIDAFIAPGTSGAPVINRRDQLVGLVTSLALGNWAYAYTTKTIKEFLSRLTS